MLWWLSKDGSYVWHCLDRENIVLCLVTYNGVCRWKVLDFAELKRSSISFFEIEKQETAVSRWSRARTRAAKVTTLSPSDQSWIWNLGGHKHFLG